MPEETGAYCFGRIIQGVLFFWICAVRCMCMWHPVAEPGSSNSGTSRSHFVLCSSQTHLLGICAVPHPTVRFSYSALGPRRAMRWSWGVPQCSSRKYTAGIGQSVYIESPVLIGHYLNWPGCAASTEGGVMHQAGSVSLK
jgi:hypothetical protein